MQPRPGDAFIVSDLEQVSRGEVFDRVDGGLSPDGSVLVQAQRPPRPGETHAEAAAALGDRVELGLPGWQDRTTWQRTSTANARTGVLELPGHTWHNRPTVD